ncbi:hypothetical protein Tco_1215781 [Tanacetum coccineum]
MATSIKALIVEYAYAPTHPSPPPSPLLSLSSPLLKIPSPPLLLPPPHTSPTYASATLGYRATMVQLRATLPLLVPLPPLFEVGESLTDTIIRAFEGRVMTAIGEVNERVTDLSTTQRQAAHELYVRCEDAQDDQALLRAQISLLMKERRNFCSMASSYKAQEARITALEAQTRAL